MSSDITLARSSHVAERVVYGLWAILIIIGVVTVDAYVAAYCRWEGPLGDLLRRGSTIPIVATILTLRGAAELRYVLGAMGIRPVPGLLYLGVAAFMLTPWFSAAGWLGQRSVHLEAHYWQLSIVMLCAVAACVAQVLRATPSGAIRDVGGLLLGALYVGFLPSFAIHIRCAVDRVGSEGAFLLLFLLLTIKAADIGAYFAGTFAGRHKLVPAISPKKSVEGFAGGVFFSALVAVLLVALGRVLASPNFADSMPDYSGGSGLRYLSRIATGDGLLGYVGPAVLGAVLSVFGQIGDLFESCLKREAGVKDSGAVMPTFGGVLDLIDSPVVAIPVGWFLLSVVWGIL